MGRLISLMSVGSLAERNRAGAECFITVSTRSDMSTPVSGTEVFCVVCAGVGTWLIEHGLLNLTRRARNLKVIDLAIERLAFWNEYLKAVEVAGDRQQMRDRAFDRILHVVEYVMLNCKSCHGFRRNGGRLSQSGQSLRAGVAFPSACPHQYVNRISVLGVVTPI